MCILEDIQENGNIHCAANNPCEHAKVSWPTVRRRGTEVLHANRLRNHDPKIRCGPTQLGTPYSLGSVSATTGRSEPRTHRRHSSAAPGTGPAIVRFSTCRHLLASARFLDPSLHPQKRAQAPVIVPEGDAALSWLLVLANARARLDSVRQCPGHYLQLADSSLDSRTLTVQSL